MPPCIVTITGIRPDFIRMSRIFEKLDKYFNHILIHTGQHYDKLLSDIFFQDLKIRQPNYILNTGKESTNHFEQLSYLSKAIPELFKKEHIAPDLIIFLGDSNTAGVAYPLKKEGYKICHIEAGMRSYDKRMLEEINRTICDHCSDILFVYHNDYKTQLEIENIKTHVYVVGNTIVEPVEYFKKSICDKKSRKDMILVDIHRPENFNYEHRLRNIISIANKLGQYYNLPIKLLNYKRLLDSIQKWSIPLGGIEICDLMSFPVYLDTIYHSRFIVSDSGTGQEEPALLGVPVLVPRDFTERPQSYAANCSFHLCVNDRNILEQSINDAIRWISSIESGELQMNISWLGNGRTSDLVLSHLFDYFGMTTAKSLLNYEKNKMYNSRQPFPHLIIDEYLLPEFANQIQKEILELDISTWDRYQNPFEKKWTLRDKFSFPPSLDALFRHFESKSFVEELSTIVGVKLLLDPTRNFWGVHTYDNGDKLDIHVDAGIHPLTKQKKKVTVGIYFSKNWKDEYGCQLELWKGTNAGDTEPILLSKECSVSPLFNRLVIFTCNDYSWHGNPEPALFLENTDAKRIFVTISYLCDENEDLNRRVKAYFVARPNDLPDIEKDKMRILRADPEKYKEIYKI